MKRFLLLLSFSIGAAYSAQAQATLVQAVSAGLNIGRLMRHKQADKEADKQNKQSQPASVVGKGSYQGKSFPMARTPAEQLAGQPGAEQVVALETELARCYTALQATADGLLCTPEQQTVLLAAMRNVVQTKSANIAAYQQEAAFYLAENAKRQKAAAPALAPN